MTGERVRAAFDAVHREDFLPADQRSLAALDQALPIGHQQTNSQPRTVAQMLALLDVCPGQQVLDVGSGSGWTTALLGHLVGPEGRVIGVEIVPELVRWSRQNLGTYAMPWTEIRQATQDELGAPADGPFDRILVSAEAPELPQPLVDQLDENGVLVIPVSGRLVIAERRAGDVRSRRHGHYQFVPLR
ncbi:MAG: protein-L-isoaspartate O-methyltransferase family protein [Nocardioidaceae bacterium]